MSSSLIAAVNWNTDQLVATIAQDAKSGRVLMMAWMNPESLQISLDEGYACYWSRSRGRLWRKGESSGHRQKIQDIRLDCDGDTILIQVEQAGGIACHTGRESCFYLQPQGDSWVAVDPILKDSKDIYS